MSVSTEVLNIKYAVGCFVTTVKPSNGHFGTNLNQSYLPVVIFKRFKLDRKIKLGGLFVSIVERRLLQCPFIRKSVFKTFHCRRHSVL